MTAMSPSTTRSLLAAAILAWAGSAAADPTPTDSTAGVVFDNPAAGVTDITAPDGAIINYSSFDVAPGETVNFIQPSATARVLNRINSAVPTEIHGTINANGFVYFVNPSGVRFEAGSVVNAAGIFAAGASLSDADFLAENHQFNNVAGDIYAAGTINAQTFAVLIGHNINHTGTINVPEGLVVMASGDSVYMGSPLGGLLLGVDAEPYTGEEGTISQDGTVNARQLNLVAGDLYSIVTPPLNNARPDPTPIRTIAEIDTDGDGDIDNDDIDTALANFTGPLPPGTGGKTQQQGDTDGDGDVDNTDLGTLIIYFTGSLTPPPPDNPGGPFNLQSIDAIGELPPIAEEVNLTEADLGILRDQLGIAARPALASERIEEVESVALHNDHASRPENTINPDGSLTIANMRLDADIVRSALQLYRERLEVQGVSPADRAAQIRDAIQQAYNGYSGGAGEGYDPDAFVAYAQQNNPELVEDLAALNELRTLTSAMGLNGFEKANSEQTIVNRSRPAALSFEQMQATLESASALLVQQQATEEPAAG